jgi:hypothetical protein
MGMRKWRFSRVLIDPIIGMTACMMFGRFVHRLISNVLISVIRRLEMTKDLTGGDSVAEKTPTQVAVGRRSSNSANLLYAEQ